MAKQKNIFMCSSCGNDFPKWSGQCPACKEWNTISQVFGSFLKSSPKQKTSSINKIKPQTPKKTLESAQTSYQTTSISEIDRVLGQGLTPGGVYLLTGQPGIGKSTLLTQLAIKISQTISNQVLYVCSEENSTQVATRINRFTKKDTNNLNLLNTSNVESILDQNALSRYNLVIIDSIQSIQTDLNPTSPGSPSQIKDSANLIIRMAKETQTPVILIGHVTKSGSIAGPKLLEHMVDSVLELSGDRQHNLRLLRSVKNRFGPTDETGIFQMTGKGLEEVKDPSKFMLEGRVENAPGSSLCLIMEGTRPLTVEIQALVVPSNLAIPRRVAKGININRLQLICAVLTKHLKLPLGNKDVFVNVTAGYNLTEPGADLGIALAIISSSKNKPLPNNAIAFGELGLLGEIRSVNFQDKRIKEAKTLGYKITISPENTKHLKQIDLSSRT
ncbi:DNA repair protein RadA [Patescibacteria group bacterium]|nr:DNA repair protein RadA [Patescibacteria group bacterium]